MKKIATEEHFLTQGMLEALCSKEGYPRIEITEDREKGRVERIWRSPDHFVKRNPNDTTRLLDLGEGRLKEMDEAGIDMQVLSLMGPAVEVFSAAEGTALAKATNDEVSMAVRANPTRFAGFATVAPQDPNAAADELVRAVKELGLIGVKINSHVGGEYLDDRKFWSIFEAAEKLDVPIYIHPREPSASMLKAYEAYPALASAMWGYGAEVGLHAMRLICSGLFDEYPGLKIILGHLGEAIPFWLWRLDNRWAKGGAASPRDSRPLKKNPSQYVRENFFMTTSGMFWVPALLCVYMGLGADRILLAVDHPFESSSEAVHFIEEAPICESDREKICHLNAEKLFKL